MPVDGYATQDRNYQYFTSTGTYTVVFTRSINSLIITFSGTNNMSMDGGTNYISMTAGTYQFDHLGFCKRLHFTGGGTRSGFGIAS